MLQKAGKNARVDFGGGDLKWVPFTDLELTLPRVEAGAPNTAVLGLVAVRVDIDAESRVLL